MKLTNDQQNTINDFNDFLATVEAKYMIINGYSGSGKSTLIKPLIDIAYKHIQMNNIICKTPSGGNVDAPLLAATTNPAVAVVEKLTNYPAATIHSILGLKVMNNYSTGEKYLKLKHNALPIYNRLIIIDEASMINNELFSFIDTRTINCKILLIGDKNQLAPVNQTTTIMESIACSMSTLTEIKRNSGLIQETGAMYRRTVETGVFHPIKPDNISMFKLSGKDFQREINNTFGSKKYHPKQAKIIAWTNTKVQQYNNYIRRLRQVPELLQIGEVVITNKPLMHKKRTYKSIDTLVTITDISHELVEVIDNTEILGRYITINNHVTAFMPSNVEAEKIILKQLAKKKSWKSYFNVKDTWLDLRLPYACTAHKSQGNTYDKVFVNLSDIGKCKIPSDVARMLYVSITRAKEKVYLYGELPACYTGTIN